MASEAAPAAVPAGGLQRRIGRFVVRHWPLCALLVVAVMACNVFIRLGALPVNDSDEARYGVSAFEMLRRHSFLVTTYALRPEYWNLKPPLGYWLIALSYRLLGAGPFSLRLPSALSGIAAVGLTIFASRRWLGRRESILAGLVLASGFGFLSHHGVRSGDLDAALTLLVLLAALQVPRFAERPWRVVAFGALLSLGFLLKSFAILPIVIVTALYLAWTGEWRRLRWGPCLLALLTFALPVATWAGLRWRADGSPMFLERMVSEDLMARSTRVIDKVSYHPYSYAIAIFDRFAPWPLLVLLVFALAWFLRHRREPTRFRWLRPQGALLLLLLWALVPLVLFSIAKTHHHWYLDPTYPAWAMLTAAAILQLLEWTRPAWRNAALVACVALPLLACELRLAYRVAHDGRHCREQLALVHLKDRRAQLGTRLRTPPLRHSERFILEAMDGFDVDEIADAKQAPSAWPSLIKAEEALGATMISSSSEVGRATKRKDHADDRRAVAGRAGTGSGGDAPRAGARP